MHEEYHIMLYALCYYLLELHSCSSSPRIITDFILVSNAKHAQHGIYIVAIKYKPLRN